ncbi:hypothetical protein CC85DRAFT_61681 [Cutaneotrichosporon oleaginosum]|uniref:Uncharacterized protein n=1 Tax=Cutaneotrichosporon oleaginosum TaxID=879819 RepID=A0A0J0XQB1_9TREE|nr:uncharacterized protein CC85DRAFT_61681 [Cutaneotrichosporon oleaginosum]KLT43305.1 hypothetical protein CC85DRAFT_61681 [Cutaneotrichosporon oleaginosum]TXT14433.1 hypothetical protein COLE_00626 [Cutaneotrichosporon oleaginosum]
MSTMSSRQSPSSAEKRALASSTVAVPGIVVPGIVLTQAGDQDLEAERQLPPPSPHQVVLLAPGVVYPGRKGRAARGIPQAARQLVCVALVVLAFWHLWSTLDMGAMHVPITDVTP